MDKKDINFKNIPDEPGVYRFIGPKREVLYVGKATSLRDRVKSYFQKDIAEIRSPLIAKIVKDAVTVEWDETDSVLEALILEAKSIKKYEPIGNTDNKDNKSWNYVVVTDEKFPRVLVARERELTSKFSNKTVKHLFGPFPSSGQLRDALKIIRKIFPFFDTPFPILDVGHQVYGRRTAIEVTDLGLTSAQEKKIQFNQSIGLYPKEFNEKEYRKTIRAIVDLFSAKKETLIKRLEREMYTLAKKEEFEKAEVKKRQVFALKHIQDVTLVKDDLKKPETAEFRVEAYDTAHIRGSEPRGVMSVVVDGEVVPSEYRTFTIRNGKAGDDYAALDEIIERRAKHREWPRPMLVVIDGGRAHLNRAKKTLKDVGMDAEVVSVVKDKKHRPREILGPGSITITHEPSILLANAEAHRFAIGKHRKALRKKTIS